MTKVQACLLCGQEDHDVEVGLVEFPESERRDVTVRVPATHRDGAVEVQLTVPERYAPMPRCRDVKACLERQSRIALAQLEAYADAQAVAEAAADAAPEPEDPLAWL